MKRESTPLEEENEMLEKISPIESKIIPFLNLSFNEIKEKTGLDETSVLRALRFLEAKNLLQLSIKENNIIELGINGIYYKKHHLPERNLLIFLEKNNKINLEEAKKGVKLTDNEFKVSLGVLKNKAMISLSAGKIILNASREELAKKSLEEQLIDILPKEESLLQPEMHLALENLKKRKDIVEISRKSLPTFTLTETGKRIAGKEINLGLLEELTPEVIKSWSKGKKFRKYDLSLPVPKIYGGKRHFVNQAVEYGKKIWLDLGFKEMSGNMADSSLWIFDSLFTPQDHPARDMQDTFFIKGVKSRLPAKEIVEGIKKAHTSGVGGSLGWRYSWKEDEAKKVVLRTHTTGLSARALSNLKKSDLPAKYFTIGKVFRNETADWNHGFEFYQTEGIVIDKNVNFRHLLGYLKIFYKKMGFENIRFRPSYFAYTEPSVEIEVFHPEKKRWIELGGAGIFRPEVVIPLLGEDIPVLAWGQGFDRIIMEAYKIKDLREMYKNDIKYLREIKFW